MGVVYKAEDTKLGRMAALKFLRQTGADLFAKQAQKGQRPRGVPGTPGVHDMRTNLAVRLGLLFALSLILATTVIAQSRSSGSIEGRVVDSTGAPVPEAKVTATNTGSGAARTAETDMDGHFWLPAVAIGSYTIRAQAAGLVTLKPAIIQVSLGQTVVHVITLQPETVVQKVEVAENADVLESTATTYGVALGSERVDEAPAQNRNYLNIVLTAPGVTASAGSNTMRAAAALRSPAADSGFSFGGMRARNNSLNIDGADNRDETTGGNRVALGLEMVQEFRVSGTSVGAEFGGASGGTVNVVTHTGSNIWHGDVTFFGQNEALNARNPEIFTRYTPRYRRWAPGASIEGPARRDRTFFAMAFEQEWESEDEWSEVPEGFGQQIRSALASPAFAKAAVKTAQDEAFRADSSQTEYSFKLTHILDTKNTFSARYAFSRGRIGKDVFGEDNFADQSARGSSLTRDHSFVGGWIAVPNGRLVNDLHAQFSRRSVAITPNSRGAMLEVPGVITLGQAYRLNASRTEDHYQLVDSLSMIRGKHQLSAGIDIHAVRLDSRLADRFGGIFIFPTMDAFLRGTPDVFSQAFGNPATSITTIPLGLWFQDKWQAGQGVSVEAGLRYDRQAMPSRIPASNRNVAPRLGVAWRPGNSHYVFRAGAGLFYDRYPLAFLNQALQEDGVNAFEQYAVGSAAAAAFALAQAGTLLSPVAGLPHLAYRAASQFKTTYSRKVTAGVERSFGPNTTAAVEYSYVRGFHLPLVRNTAGTLPPSFQLEQTGRSSYQGVAFSANRRMSKEASFLVAYNLGHAYDDSSDYDEQPMRPLDLAADWARSRQHQLHHLAVTTLFELPTEDLKSLPKWLQDATKRISVTPILNAGSGRPLNALETTDVLRTGAFPISARPAGLARNPFYTGAMVNLDVRVMKTFMLKHERARLQTGFESFNLMNHTNPLRVSPYYAAMGTPLGSYGSPVESLNPRQIQFMFQIEY